MSPRRSKDNKKAREELYQKLQDFDPELARKLRQLLEPDGLLDKRYSNICLLEKGGFGLIFKARDINLKRAVAIKLLHNVENEKQRRQFNWEATIIANLRHSALPVVLDYFCEGDLQFLVMLLIEGEDLGKLLKRKVTFTVLEILRHGDTLLDAVDHLHTQQDPIIHRDIKPANIILTKEKKIVLLDFGLAKGEPDSMSLLSEKRKRTLSMLAFTLYYAPLEQLNGAGTDTRSDIFSAGATLYHLATGERPSHTAAERWREIAKGNPDPLPLAHELNPSIPIKLSQVLARAMAINSGDRFASAAEMRLELAKIQAEVVGVSQEMEELVRRFEESRLAKEETPNSATDYSSRESLPSTRIMKKESQPEPLLSDEEDKLRTRRGTRALELEALPPVLESEDESIAEEETLLRAGAEISQSESAAQRETPIVSSVAQFSSKKKKKSRSERRLPAWGAIAAILSVAFASAILVGLLRERKINLAPNNTQANASAERMGSSSGNISAEPGNISTTTASSNTASSNAQRNSNVAAEVVRKAQGNKSEVDNTQKTPAQPIRKEDPRKTFKLETLYAKLKPSDELAQPYLNAPPAKRGYGHSNYILPFNRGNELLKQGKPEEAAKQYELVIKLNRYYAPAYYNLAEARMQQGRLEEASENYLKAIKYKQDFAEAYRGLGDVYVKLGKDRKAIEKYQEAIRCNRNLPGVYLSLGNIYVRRNRMKEAGEHFELAAKYKKDFAEAIFNQGLVKLFLKDEQAAREQHRKLRKIKPAWATKLLNTIEDYSA